MRCALIGALLVLSLLLRHGSLVFTSAASLPADSAHAARPPARTNTPTFRPLHVLSTVLTASPTHAVAPFEICKQLAKRGHHITWVDMVAHDKWYSADDRREANFHGWVKAGDDVLTNWSAVWNEWISPQVEIGMAALDEVSRHVLEPLYPPSMRTLQRLIDEDRPDAMICDVFAHACVDIADHLNIPFVFTWPGGLGSFGLGDSFDTPSMLTEYNQQWHEQPFWHRLWNTYGTLPYTIWLLGAIEPRFNQLRAQFGIRPNVAPSDKWYGHDLIFNGNWGWDWAGYVPPYFHLLGPITRTSNKNWRAASNIAPSLRQWLDESQQLGVPVVYIALGSISYFTESQQATFVRAFLSCPAEPLSAAVNVSTQNPLTSISSSSTSPFRFIWQSNRPLAASTRAAMPSWVREEKWVAQPAVLAHPATSLFISHAGSQSIQEAIFSGLPLLCTPFFGDQPANAARLKDAGVSLTIDYKRVSDGQLCHAMRYLVYDQQVRDNVDRIQQIYHLARDGAARGADVVERAAYVGTAHLIPYRERKDVSAIIRYNLDVYAIVGGVLLLLVYGVYRMLVAVLKGGIALAGGGRSKSKLA